MNTEETTTVAPSDPVFEVFVAIQNHAAHGRRMDEFTERLTEIVLGITDAGVARSVAREISRAEDWSGRPENYGWRVLFEIGSRSVGTAVKLRDAVEAAMRTYPFARELFHESFAASTEWKPPYFTMKGGTPTAYRYVGETAYLVDDAEVLSAAIEMSGRFNYETRAALLTRFAELVDAERLYTVLERHRVMFSDHAVKAVLPKLPAKRLLELGVDPGGSYHLRQAALGELDRATIAAEIGKHPEHVERNLREALESKS